MMDAAQALRLSVMVYVSHGLWYVQDADTQYQHDRELGTRIEVEIPQHGYGNEHGECEIGEDGDACDTSVRAYLSR